MDNFLLLPRVLAAALSDIAFASSFGLVIVSFWLPRDSDSAMRGTLRRVLVLCAGVMLIALSAQVFLLTATMAGSSELSVLRNQSVDVMTGTHAGRALLSSYGLTLILLVLLLARRKRQVSAEAIWLSAVLVLLAATRAATGHAAADGDFTVPEFVQLIHWLSIAIWSGGVIATGFIVLPAMLRAGRVEAIAQFARSLSRTVTLALLLVVFSGVYNSYRGLGGSLAPLAGTQWGYLLDIKVVLVCTALAMGLSSRLMLRAHAGLSLPQASRLGFILRLEAMAMVCILAVSAWLANSPPPNSL